MPLTAEHGLLAIAKSDSKNEKIGDAAATYAAQASCPSSCVFFNGGGCYAENGLLYTGLTMPLNEAARRAHATPRDVAVEEAEAIDALAVTRGRPLRLHTVGDCRTDEAAQIVSAACARYVERGGGPVWTYTHAWRTVDRSSWGDISVLASCETPEQVELARARGYATALVVDEFASPRLHDCRTAPVTRVRKRGNTGSPLDPVVAAGLLVEPVTGQRPGSGGAPVTSAAILPCPAQTHDDITCSNCRLCMDDAALILRRYSIGFAVHGTAFTTKKAVESLRRPSDPTRRLTSRDHALTYLDEHGRLPSTRALRDLADVTYASAIDMLARLRRELETRRATHV